MPQVDLSTFLPIVFWAALIYVSGFLFFNLTFLYDVFATMKLVGKRAAHIVVSATNHQMVTLTLFLFTWLGL